MRWERASAAPGSPCPVAGWEPAEVPGTVPGGPEVEDEDHWYRSRVEGPALLELDGLATLADVFLDGRRVLQSANMFRAHRLELEDGEQQLLIVFRSLTAHLAGRRARPRWKTALVEEQKLRWVRTSLWGRVPGWTPLTPTVGPWRAVRSGPLPRLEELRLWADGEGRVRFTARARVPVSEALLRVGGHEVQLSVEGQRLSGEALVPDAPLWWPHTHGPQETLPCSVVLDGEELACGRVGFRSIDFEEGQLQVNGRPVFCRGAACNRLDLSPELLREARAQGLNMVRFDATGAYASEELLQACDELGLLVWQDLPFARMDPPFEDEAFRAEVEAELGEALARMRRHPCVVVVCGGSEVEQQAAMLGLREGVPALRGWLAEKVRRELPEAAWVPNSPSGGPLPFHTRTGVTHYFGVGAYRRPLGDARRAGVRFATECLSLSNLPSKASVQQHFGSTAPPTHGPAWKGGVPRDRGAGWDFEDVRDHYLRELFGEQPVELRAVDLERYHELSRAVVGELLLRTYAEWRRPGSGCGGALVWLLQDLVPGAGCGLFDSDGRVKPSLHALRRAWARRAVLLTDEGLDGVDVHVLNESDEVLEGRVELELLHGAARTGQASAPVRVEPWSAITLNGEALFEGFADLAWAYRFGPPRHRVVLARLVVEEEELHQDALFVGGYGLPQVSTTVEASLEEGPEGRLLRLKSPVFLQSVSLESRGWTPDDEGFHLAPDRPRTVLFRPDGPAPPSLRVRLSALNLDRGLTIR